MSLKSLTLMMVALGAGWLAWHSSSHGATVMERPGVRLTSLPAVETSPPGFTSMPPLATGILFTNYISESRHLTNQILLNGSGVAVGDVDGDGWCDLYFCSIDGPNRLYRNLGNWRFEDVTQAAGVECPNLDATGALFSDLDGDGDLDLVVNSVGGGTWVFANDGRGHFTRTAQLDGRKGGMSAAAGDLDGDGFLDLYIANYRTTALMDMPNARATFKVVDGKNTIDRVNGRPLTDPALTNRFIVGRFGSVEELGEADSYYRNQGGTNFTEIGFTSGAFLDEDGHTLTSPPLDWGLSVVIRDIDGDGQPDLYVCNDFETPDRLWLNRANGHLQAAPALTLRKSSLFSMGIDFADINRDGRDDFLVADMLNRDHRLRLTQMLPLPPLPEEVSGITGRPQYMASTLFLNRGDGTYAEIAALAGLEAFDWSWLPIFLDVDLDGWEDLLVSTGHERAARDLDIADQMKLLRRNRRSLSDAEIFQARRAFPRLATGNLAFRNRGDLTFEEVGKEWGFNDRSVSQGMALADLDNDGDLDVVVNKSNAAAGIYRNNCAAPRLAVRLIGLSPNTAGIGARITVQGAGLPMQSQEMVSGGRYLSCDQAMRVFAAGSATNVLRVDVRWRNGKHTIVPQAKPNSLCEVNEKAAQESSLLSPTTPRRSEPPASPGFQDLSAALHHVHQDPTFNDYARQPLIPYRLSQLGPGVTWFDVNRDGWEDVVLPSGKGGRLAIYTNNTHGGFGALTLPILAAPIARDQTTVMAWESDATNITLLAGSAIYEDATSAGPALRIYELSSGAVTENFPASPSSTGPLALADVNGDGQLDLFVGGRSVPGKYPAASSSGLYLFQQGRFELDARNAMILTNLGMVSGAVFSDLDNDGDADLVLACEWGPIRVLGNEHGVFSDRTDALGLGRWTGWWNGVSTGDFDGDGRLDIVASNWGRNTKYQSYRAEPLQVYYGDFDGDGTADLIEAHYDASLKKVVPDRPLGPMAQAMPFLRGRFATHRAYAEASVAELLGDFSNSAKSWSAACLESMVFLNRGDHFEAHALPVEAQMAPAFGVSIGDLDGDGYEDVLLSQNIFAVQPETPRCDAGLGLWLRGDGRGGFSTVSSQESGIRIFGEQRGAALCDFDHDGKVDLLVAQNAAETKLYRNLRARPGLRVRLKGSQGNMQGVGATLRLVEGNRVGPAREIHAGAGYWSQDAACQVMNLDATPTGLLVRWPGGKETRSVLPGGAREVMVDMEGRVEVVSRSGASSR